MHADGSIATGLESTTIYDCYQDFDAVPLPVRLNCQSNLLVNELINVKPIQVHISEPLHKVKQEIRLNTTTFGFHRLDFGTSFEPMLSYLPSANVLVDEVVNEKNRSFFVHLGLATGIHPYILQSTIRREAKKYKDNLSRKVEEGSGRVNLRNKLADHTTKLKVLGSVLNNGGHVAHDILKFIWPTQFNNFKIWILITGDVNEFVCYCNEHTGHQEYKDIFIVKEGHRYFTLRPEAKDMDIGNLSRDIPRQRVSETFDIQEALHSAKGGFVNNARNQLEIGKRRSQTNYFDYLLNIQAMLDTPANIESMELLPVIDIRVIRQNKNAVQFQVNKKVAIRTNVKEALPNGQRFHWGNNELRKLICWLMSGEPIFQSGSEKLIDIDKTSSCRWTKRILAMLEKNGCHMSTIESKIRNRHHQSGNFLLCYAVDIAFLNSSSSGTPGQQKTDSIATSTPSPLNSSTQKSSLKRKTLEVSFSSPTSVASQKQKTDSIATSTPSSSPQKSSLKRKTLELSVSLPTPVACQTPLPTQDLNRTVMIVTDIKKRKRSDEGVAHKIKTKFRAFDEAKALLDSVCMSKWGEAHHVQKNIERYRQYFASTSKSHSKLHDVIKEIQFSPMEIEALDEIYGKYCLEHSTHVTMSRECQRSVLLRMLHHIWKNEEYHKIFHPLHVLCIDYLRPGCHAFKVESSNSITFNDIGTSLPLEARKNPFPSSISLHPMEKSIVNPLKKSTLTVDELYERVLSNEKLRRNMRFCFLDQFESFEAIMKTKQSKDIVCEECGSNSVTDIRKREETNAPRRSVKKNGSRPSSKLKCSTSHKNRSGKAFKGSNSIGSRGVGGDDNDNDNDDAHDSGCNDQQEYSSTGGGSYRNENNHNDHSKVYCNDTSGDNNPRVREKYSLKITESINIPINVEIKEYKEFVSQISCSDRETSGTSQSGGKLIQLDQLPVYDSIQDALKSFELNQTQREKGIHFLLIGRMTVPKPKLIFPDDEIETGEHVDTDERVEPVIVGTESIGRHVCVSYFKDDNPYIEYFRAGEIVEYEDSKYKIRWEGDDEDPDVDNIIETVDNIKYEELVELCKALTVCAEFEDSKKGKQRHKGRIIQRQIEDDDTFGLITVKWDTGKKVEYNSQTLMEVQRSTTKYNDSNNILHEKLKRGRPSVQKQRTSVPSHEKMGRPSPDTTLILFISNQPHVLLVSMSTKRDKFLRRLYRERGQQSIVDVGSTIGVQRRSAQLLSDPPLYHINAYDDDGETITAIDSNHKWDNWNNELGIEKPMQISQASFPKSEPKSILLSNWRSIAIMSDDEFYRANGMISDVSFRYQVRTALRRLKDQYINAAQSDPDGAEIYKPPYNVSNIRNYMLSTIPHIGESKLTTEKLVKCWEDFRKDYKIHFDANPDLEGALLALLFMDSSWRRIDEVSQAVTVTNADVDIDSTAAKGIIDREKLYEYSKEKGLKFDRNLAVTLNAELNKKDCDLEFSEHKHLSELLTFWASEIFDAISFNNKFRYKTAFCYVSPNQCNRQGRDVTNLTSSGKNTKDRREDPPENIPGFCGEDVLNASFRFLHEEDDDEKILPEESIAPSSLKPTLQPNSKSNSNPSAVGSVAPVPTLQPNSKSNSKPTSHVSTLRTRRWNVSRLLVKFLNTKFDQVTFPFL